MFEFIAPIGYLSSVVFVIFIDPFRWKWAAFVLFGIGAALPETVVHEEDDVRTALGKTENLIHIVNRIKSQAPR